MNWKESTKSAIQKLRDRALGGLAAASRSEITKWAIQGARTGIASRGADFWINLSAVIVCAFFLADLLGLGIEYFVPEPTSSLRGARPMIASRNRVPVTPETYQAICTRNLFNSKGLGCESDTGGPVDNAPVRTSLPLNLVGTVILRDELRSLATIEDKASSNVYPVRANDEIPGKIKIQKVEARKVTFLNLQTRQNEYVDLPEEFIQTPRLMPRGNSLKSSGPGIEQLSPTQYNVSRQEVDKTLSDLNSVLTQARCLPYMEGGVPAGFRCFQIVKGSIYDQLGMKDNDVVTCINGSPINDITKAMELLTSLKEASHLELCLKRDGKQMNMAYDIK